jgi:hypothetical protein
MMAGSHLHSAVFALPTLLATRSFAAAEDADGKISH